MRALLIALSFFVVLNGAFAQDQERRKELLKIHKEKRVLHHDKRDKNKKFERQREKVKMRLDQKREKKARRERKHRKDH